MAKQRLGSPRGRLFVALDLPGEVRSALAEWQRGMDDPALRPVRAENLHMTLVFLGWQAVEDFERIAEAALGLGGPAAPLPAAPVVELLPEPAARPPKRPRLYALEARSPETVALQAALSRRLEGAGAYEPKRSPRPFWPHLTVARVRPEKRGGRRPARVATPPGPLGGTPVRFRPTRLVVFQSHLHPSGARYEPMAELELPTAETNER